MVCSSWSLNVELMACAIDDGYLLDHRKVNGPALVSIK